MRLLKPHPASLDEVTITRDGQVAVIEFRQPGIASTYLRLGDCVRSMSDREILGCFNESLRDHAHATEGECMVLEIPAGIRQIEYFEAGRHWAPRGSVLRCLVDDSGPDGETVVFVDDIELSLAEFGKMLCTFSGWGMRICFVPEERLTEVPRIEIGEPGE